MKHLLLALFFIFSLSMKAQEMENLMNMSPIHRACLIIRHYESWHQNPHEPQYIGWGHRIQPHERHLNQNITREQGDSLLYEDLRKLVIHFKSYGKDALLLATLCYNVGQVAVEGNKTRPPSKLIQKIRSGNRDFKEDYLDYCRYRSKVVPSIQRRRLAEWIALYEK